MKASLHLSTHVPPRLSIFLITWILNSNPPNLKLKSHMFKWKRWDWSSGASAPRLLLCPRVAHTQKLTAAVLEYLVCYKLSSELSVG